MASSATEHRQYAAECVALSERVANPLDKARLIQMAQDFLEMAKKEERSTKERQTLLRPES
jgi:hypothetical protein